MFEAYSEAVSDSVKMCIVEAMTLFCEKVMKVYHVKAGRGVGASVLILELHVCSLDQARRYNRWWDAPPGPPPSSFWRSITSPPPPIVAPSNGRRPPTWCWRQGRCESKGSSFTLHVL